MSQRPGRFMPVSLLTSHLETLASLEADEVGLVLNSDDGIEDTAERICGQLGSLHHKPAEKSD